MEKYYNKNIIFSSVTLQLELVKIELLNRILDEVKKRDVR